MSYLAQRMFEVIKPPIYNLNSKGRGAETIDLPNSTNPVAVPLEWEMLDAVPVGILILDNQGRVVYENTEALNIIGGGLKGACWYQIINDYFIPQQDDGFDLTLKNGKRVKLKTNAFNRGKSQLISIVDVSDSRRYQEKRSHEDRVYQTGQMVSKLAHQIRTPLSASLIYANLLSTEEDKYKRKLIEGLNQIENQVQDILLYCRKKTLLDQQVNIVEAMKGLVDDFSNPDTRNIDIELEYNASASSASIMGNQVALLGAFGNVINNAIEAHAGCRLNGACEDDLKIKVAVLNDMKSLTVSVCDNGPGLDPELATQVLEPFYTTKSNGTGLGLSVVNSVVAAHGGKVSFDKSPLGGLKLCMEFTHD